MDDSRLNDIEFEIRKASSDYDYKTTEYLISTIVNKYKIGKIFGPYYHHQNAVLGFSSVDGIIIKNSHK